MNQRIPDLANEMKLKIAQGDELSFEKFYNEYNKRLFNFASSLLKSREMAEEVVEDVFVKIWYKRETIVEIENLTLYLYTATKNNCLNALAKKSNQIAISSIELLDLDFYSSTNDLQDQLIASEMIQMVNVVVESLPKRCKLIFKLIREDGLKYKEVAEILGISVNTIDAQMAIAVRRICTALNISKDKIIF